MIFFSLQFRKVDWLWPFRLALHHRALSRPLQPTWIIFHFAFWMNRSSAIFGYSRTLLLRSCLLWFSATDRYIFSFYSALNIEQAGASRICWDHQQESTDGEASQAGARERNSIKFCYMTQRHLSKPFIDFDYERNFFPSLLSSSKEPTSKAFFPSFVDDEWGMARNGLDARRREEIENMKIFITKIMIFIISPLYAATQQWKKLINQSQFTFSSSQSSSRLSSDSSRRSLNALK